MDILEVLEADYRKFPHDQNYSLYAPEVFFKDPITEFRGVKRYRLMIGLMRRFFSNPRLDLHAIKRNGPQIQTHWTLSWNGLLPWYPRIRIDGWSELSLDEQERITSHIDYWHCSRLAVLKQHFQFKR